MSRRDRAGRSHNKAHTSRMKATTLTLFVAAFLSASGALAAPVSLNSQIGFGGRFHHGIWSPIRLDLEAQADFSGQIELQIPRTTLRSVKATYVTLSHPIHMQKGEKRRYWFSVPLQSSPHPLISRLIDSGGRTAAQQEVPLQEASWRGHIVLVLDPDAGNWNWLETPSPTGRVPSTPSVYTAYVRDPEGLPDNVLSLASLSAIVIRHSFPTGTLSPNQVTAIRRFVEFGGRLVLTGGSSIPRLSSWADWLPQLATGEITFVETNEGVKIPAWRLVPRPEGPVTSEEAPLLTAKSQVGSGTVAFIAVDPSSEPAADLGTPEDWKDVIVPSALPKITMLPVANQEAAWQLLGKAKVPTPPQLNLILVIVIYVGAVIASSLWAIRRPKVLAAFPVLVLAATLVTGSFLKTERLGDRLTTGEIQVAHGLSNGTVLNRTFGIFDSTLPYSHDITLTATAPAPFPAPSETGADIAAVVTDSGIRLEAVSPLSSIRYFHDALDKIAVSAYIDTDRSEVTVLNSSTEALRYAFVVEHDNFLSLGTIDPGARVTARHAPSTKTTSDWVALGIQSSLARLNSNTQPTEFEAKLIALAVNEGLEGSFLSGNRDRPLLVALTDPVVSVNRNPPGSTFRRRVIVLPFYRRTSKGGSEREG